MLAKILIATLIISSGSLIGLLILSASDGFLKKILLYLVSLSAGTLMGGAMFHLLPESIEKLGNTIPFYVAVSSFLLFFLIEKLLRWHHCHDQDCKKHDHQSLGYLNLIGDLVHNFIDGLVIAATFLFNPGIGITTTLAIGIHEIPQEIGDFGVLLHSGFNKQKALIANLAVSLSVVLGGIVGYFSVRSVQSLIPYLLPFAAGGFLYISASDLMPEIKKEVQPRKTLLSLFMFLVGLAIMLLLKR